MARPWDCQGCHHLPYTPVGWFSISRKKGRGCLVKSVSNGFEGSNTNSLIFGAQSSFWQKHFKHWTWRTFFPQRSLLFLIALLQHLVWMITTQSSSYLLRVPGISQPGKSGSYAPTSGDTPLWKRTAGKTRPDPCQEDICAYFSRFLTLAYY